MGCFLSRLRTNLLRTTFLARYSHLPLLDPLRHQDVEFGNLPLPHPVVRHEAILLEEPRVLNERLRAMPGVWTKDIVAKKNAPHLRYTEPGLYRRFDGEYERLADFLL